MTLRLGTRGSVLARTQSQQVADALHAATGEPVELVEIVTTGDRSTAPVPQLGVGVFVSALREALVAKEIDIAVHSYKDLPTGPAEGLTIAAVPLRADPRDALISSTGRGLAGLAPGARIGTGALRRVAQLRASGGGLTCLPIRGNVDTRLRKLASGEFDAVVLAAAGMHRLGRTSEITELLDPKLMLPAPAQGALAVECRVDAVAPDGTHLVELLSCLDDEPTRLAVAAERAMLAALEAGCSAPVAALAEVCESERGEPEIYLRGAVISPEGDFAVRLSRTETLTDAPGPASRRWEAASAVGQRLAADLLAEGAETVLGVQHDPHP